MGNLLKFIVGATFLGLAAVGTIAIVSQAKDGNLNKLDGRLQDLKKQKKRELNKIKKQTAKKIDAVSKKANSAAKKALKA